MRVFVNEFVNDRRRTIFRGAVTPGMYRAVGNGDIEGTMLYELWCHYYSALCRSPPHVGMSGWLVKDQDKRPCSGVLRHTYIH